MIFIYTQTIVIYKFYHNIHKLTLWHALNKTQIEFFYYPLTWTLWYSTYIDIVPSAWDTCMLSFENEISFCTGWTVWKHNSCLLSSCGFLLLHFFCTFNNFEKEVEYPVCHVSYFIKFRECSKRMLNSKNINFFIYYVVFSIL